MRHRRNHMGALTAAVGARVEKVEQRAVAALAMTVKDRLENAITKAEEAAQLAQDVVRDARGSERYEAAAMGVRGVVAAIGEVRQCLTVLGKANGEIPTGPKVAIQVNLGGVQVDATADELRGLVARTSSFFAERHPELVAEFRAYLTEGA